MKIFISHSSKNSNYGNALIDLLISIGVSPEQIIFTSNVALGIPIGQNIFTWLKDRINEKPYVIYLLSPEYYTSVACLNEMGAAWVVNNEHTMIFTPNFKLNSYDFQNGALDPREIGFNINDQDRLTAFIESLKSSFSISNNSVLISQKIRNFIEHIKPFQTTDNTSTPKPIVYEKVMPSVDAIIQNSEPIDKVISNKTNQLQNNPSQFFSDFLNNKLKGEDILLTHYVIDMGKYKLKTGWQEKEEIQNIIAWEDVNDLNRTLSNNYANVLRKLEMRKLTKVSDVTANGNAKEVCFVESMVSELNEPSNEIVLKILEVVEKNKKTNELPF